MEIGPARVARMGIRRNALSGDQHVDGIGHCSRVVQKSGGIEPCPTTTRNCGRHPGDLHRQPAVDSREHPRARAGLDAGRNRDRSRALHRTRRLARHDRTADRGAGRAVACRTRGDRTHRHRRSRARRGGAGTHRAGRPRRPRIPRHPRMDQARRPGTGRRQGGSHAVLAHLDTATERTGRRDQSIATA